MPAILSRQRDAGDAVHPALGPNPRRGRAAPD